MSATIDARSTHRCSATPERLFDAWLDPETVRAWMRRALREMGLPGDVRQVHVEPRVGGSFTFTDARPDGEARHWGTYRVVERPRTLSFTWFTSAEEEAEGTSLVTLSIEPSGDGCSATIVHRMDAAWAAYVPQTERAWSTMLRHADEVVRGAGHGEEPQRT